LQTIFGSRILDYIIVVFTRGDEFEDNDETSEDHLDSACCPEPLKVAHKLNCIYITLLYSFYRWKIYILIF
jgi:hypothetical protein